MSTTSDQKAAELRRAALEYHEFPTPGKVAIIPLEFEFKDVPLP